MLPRRWASAWAAGVAGRAVWVVVITCLHLHPLHAALPSRRALASTDAPPPVRVCVVGAGAAGLASAKVFTAAGAVVSVIEQRGTVGGLWSDDGATDVEQSPVYDSLRTNLPTQLMQFWDFPFPEGTRSFPEWGAVRDYLEAYANHSHLAELVRFDTRVEGVWRAEDGGGGGGGGGWVVVTRSWRGSLTSEHPELASEIYTEIAKIRNLSPSDLAERVRKRKRE